MAIQTDWHPGDFAGRSLKKEGWIEDGGRWKVIYLQPVRPPRCKVT
ncbi:hypothetical protein [Streptomyces fagopyri]